MAIDYTRRFRADTAEWEQARALNDMLDDLGSHPATYAVVKQLAAASGSDDTTVINAALSSGAKIVRGLPGASYIASALTVPAGVRLDMTGCTVTQLAATSGDLCTLTGGGASVVGGTWDGNATNQSASQNRGIRVEAADDCLVSDATVQNTKFTGIYVKGSNRARVERCKTSATGYIGIFVEVVSTGSTVTGNAVVSCTVDRSSLSAASISEGGLKVHGYSSSIRCDATVVDGCTVLMPASPTDGTAVPIEVTYAYRSVVRGNTTSGGAMGVSVAASDGTVVMGNNVYNPKTYGIELAGARRCTVSANVLDGNTVGSHGIFLTQGGGNNSDYATVSGNSITGFKQRGIAVQTASYVAVTGNTITGGFDDNTYYVYLSAAPYSTISGNTLDGGSVAGKGIMLDSTSYVAITGNTLRNFTQHGVLNYSTQNGYAITGITCCGNIFLNVTSQFWWQVSGGASLAVGGAVARGNHGQVDVLDLVNQIYEQAGSGNPNGSVYGGPGSIYHNRSGGAGVSIYVQESASVANTGWVAK